MRRIYKIATFLLLLVLVAPIGSIFYYSFTNVNADFFSWYVKILNNHDFLESFVLSFEVSLIVAIFSSLVSFVLSLSWYNPAQRIIVATIIICLGLLPPDIFALCISQIPRLLSLSGWNLFFTTICLIFYTVPYGVLVLWARYYFIDESLIVSARDLGMNELNVVYKVVVLMSIPALISTFLVSFILSFNEYTRTYYLSGANNFLSEYLNGKLKSGADESIYAGSGLTIVATLIIVLIVVGVLIFNTLRNRKKEFVNL